MLPLKSALKLYVPVVSMFVVMLILFVPVSVPVPTTSLVSTFTTSISPYNTGLPVVLSVTVTSIVVFLTVLLSIVALVADSRCVAVKVYVFVVLLYSSVPVNSTVTVFSPTGISCVIV